MAKAEAAAEHKKAAEPRRAEKVDALELLVGTGDGAGERARYAWDALRVVRVESSVDEYQEALEGLTILDDGGLRVLRLPLSDQRLDLKLRELVRRELLERPGDVEGRIALACVRPAARAPRLGELADGAEARAFFA
jgi:hypothetical protein